MQDLEEAITPQTSLVSVMAVNNEIGVLQPLREIGNYITHTVDHTESFCKEICWLT